jgi:hypothetical protein
MEMAKSEVIVLKVRAKYKIIVSVFLLLFLNRKEKYFKSTLRGWEQINKNPKSEIQSKSWRSELCSFTNIFLLFFFSSKNWFLLN